MRNPTPAFRFGTTRGTSYITFFKYGESEVIRRMYEFMERYNVESANEGIEKVKNGCVSSYNVVYKKGENT